MWHHYWQLVLYTRNAEHLRPFLFTEYPQIIRPWALSRALAPPTGFQWASVHGRGLILWSAKRFVLIWTCSVDHCPAGGSNDHSVLVS